MIRDVDEIVEAAQVEIGRDAYVMYPDSRRLIPDTVLWGFASACLLEFIKPFVDLKGLGEAAHGVLEGFLQSWKSKDGFEEYVRSENLKSALEAAFKDVPSQIEVGAMERSGASLQGSLVAMGVRAVDAHRIAMEIANLVGEKNS